MNDDAEIRKKRRNLPHWTAAGAIYFITFRTDHGDLPIAERDLVFNHIKSGDGKFYRLAAVVIMPDHVHLLLEPLAGFDLSRILKGIKGVSARLINQSRKSQGTVWQDESWDRIIRDAAELDEKLNYMLSNPVRKELVADGWDWPWWYMADSPEG